MHGCSRADAVHTLRLEAGLTTVLLPVASRQADEISEDQGKDGEISIQKLTDKYDAPEHTTSARQ